MKSKLIIAIITILLSLKVFSDTHTHCEPDLLGGYDCTTTED